MSFKRKNVRRAAIAGLSLTLCATLTASVALMNFENNAFAGVQSAESLAFKDVTDQYDTSELVSSNFNSSVSEGVKNSYETRTVIVYLSGNTVLESKNSGSTVSEYLETSEGLATLRNIDREQKTFLNKLNSHGIKYQLKSTYSTIANAVAIEVNTSYVKQIKNMGGVESAVIAQTYLAPQTEESTSPTVTVNNTNVYATGIYDSSDYSDLNEYAWGTGAGTVVAIIDTGLDYTHDAFQRIPETIRMEKSEIESKIKNTSAYTRYLQNGGELTVDDVYVSDKVPYAYDYADDDADVYPSYSNHGTHVAGIVAGYDPNGYDDKNGNHINTVFKGVAPDAQLVIMKTFTDDLDSPSLGGAESENIMSALEDCVNLGVDVINMSLGSTAGFTTTDDGDDEGEIFNRIFESIRTAGISLICAASNDYSAGYGSVYGTNLATNPDSGTVGSPSTYYAALSVASISGQESPYMQATDGTAVFFENARSGDGEEYDFVNQLLNADEESKEFEYVVVGTGQSSDYRGTASKLIKGRIALIKRGINTFQEKIELAARQGAIGAIVYNNVSGNIRMSLGDVAEQNRVPAVSISMDAGNTLVNLAAQDTANGGVLGKITISKTQSAGPFMSDFSSWGTTSDLKIKPEITAHGGEITSTVPGGYAEQSGTSMAAPNMAGVTALVRNYVKTLPIAQNYSPSEITQLTNQLILSTATTVYNETGLAYSPRKQGSGLASLKNIVETNAYLYTDSTNKAYIGKNEVTDYWYEGKDYRPKAEIGADTNKVGEYTFDFNVKNMGENELSFTPKALFMTETLDSLGLAVAEKAYMLDDIAPVFTVNGNTVTNVTVASGESVTVKVTLKLSDAEKKYIDDSFKNGMFVEGFIKLESNVAGQCDLNLPFLSFYGDWEAAPMLDYTVYELAAFEQDTSLLSKPSETIWPTQAFASYYDDQYTIPLGSYCYTLADGDDPMYASMEYCAISRFNEIVSEEGIGDYATTYKIRCLYAGLLRNARQVNYKLYDVNSGEYITGGEKYRISKAYSNGGTARPAFIELELSPEELGLLSNGKYRLDFEFLFNKDSEVKEENTFSFDFYIDYEAPVLQDARIRYYDYKENNKDKQRVYLDLDIYDNHYAQSVKLCYIDTSGEVNELKLATSYVTPVRNPVLNGVNTVSIDITDIWDDYKNLLAVQIDDYALNHRSYILGNLSGSNSGIDIEAELNPGVLPDTFELAEGEDNITIGINEMHKVSLVYEGSANLSNFLWSSSSSFVDVKNGEIVGVRATPRPVRVSVTNRKGVSRTINVTVTDNVVAITNPQFSFGVINNYDDGLSKAEGTVTVRAGADLPLTLVKDPWYLPDSSITSVTYVSSAPDVATVNENGNVHTKKKGSATITATITVNGSTRFAVVVLNVHDEYYVNNMELRRYYGEGEVIDGQAGVVIIPSEKNIMSIGDDAFKDNTAITKIVIPKTVTSIGKNAFKGCTALKEVYFISDEDVDYTANNFVADADITFINRHAFEGCTSLEYVDFRNVKVITLAREVFKDCINLKKIEKSYAIGTAYDYAFLGCESLESIDLTGLHVAGLYVFSGCTSLKTVKTAKFTAIGDGMFSSLRYFYQTYDYATSQWKLEYTDYGACDNLTEITLNSSVIGSGAFANCKGFKKVTFAAADGGALEVRIGNSAFANCSSLSNVDFGNTTIKTIGAYAFSNTALTSLTFPKGVESVGAGAFEGTQIVTLDGATNGYTVSNGAVISGGVLVTYFGDAEEFIIPETVTEIGAYAFAKSTVKRITIPENVIAIGEGAFNESALESVTIVGNLTQIPAYAFRGTSLTQISLPATVEYVGNYAFADTPITSFSFAPTNKAVFGDGVFSDCSELVEIQLNAKISVMGSYTFAGCTKLNSATLPSLEELGDFTFWNTPALARVTFGAGSTVTGNYTFAAYTIEGYNYPATRTALTSVTLGDSVRYLGEGLFLNCLNLASLSVYDVEKVGDFAFYSCNSLATPFWLPKVKEIGAYAFYNCNSIIELNLNEAVTIGAGAFSIDKGRSYSSVNIPKAEYVGEFAFFGGTQSTVNIPKSLTVIGGGAFAGSANLTAFTCDADNPVYFVEDGVLYRTIPNSFGSDTYGLVAYPSAKTAETYEVKENTSRIEAFAFSDLSVRINKVVLPYTLTNIGASAFYNSGITVYEFNSVAAPALEEQYSTDIDLMLDALGTNFRGFYYANFNDYLLYYSSLTNSNPTNLTIRRPDNGTGYNTYVYSTYFANTEYIGAVMEKSTDLFVKLLDSFPSADEVSKWTTSNKTKAEVEEFAELVKTAHGYYNSFSLDEEQVKLAGQSRIDKLTAIETALRPIKSSFGITVNVTRLVAQQGSYKSNYIIGEEFDMTGLVVIVEYDDYSTEVADMSKITFVGPTGPLGKYNNEVTISGYGTTLKMRITVTEPSEEEPPKEVPKPETGCGGCGSVTAAGLSLVTIAVLIVVGAVIRKSNRGNK